MHIAYLTSIYPRASDSFIRGEISALRRQGVQISTFAIRRPDPQQLVTDELKRENRQTQYILDANKLLLVLRSLLAMIRRPIRTFGAAKLVFSSHPGGIRNRLKQFAYLVEAVELARLLQAQGITHIHNHIGENSATVAMLTSHLSRCTFSQTIHGPGIFFHPRQWALGEKIERASFTACITKFCLSQCMALARPQDWSRMRIVRCGVSEEFFAEDVKSQADAQRFLCIGRLCPEKGHLILLQAVQRIVSSGGNVQLNIVGDGESRQAIEEFVRQAGLESSVKLLGWLGAEAIRLEIMAARALVLASFAEGLPVVLMEALALRTPVIATRIAGIAELVDCENGWLVDPADVDSLASAMRSVTQLSEEELRHRGECGQQRVRQLHHNDREATKLRLLFDAIQKGEVLPDQAALETVIASDQIATAGILPSEALS